MAFQPVKTSKHQNRVRWAPGRGDRYAETRAMPPGTSSTLRKTAKRLRLGTGK